MSIFIKGTPGFWWIVNTRCNIEAVLICIMRISIIHDFTVDTRTCIIPLKSNKINLVTHSFEYKTALEDVLRAQGGLEATPFERVQTYVTSNVVFKPFYWKGAWMNQGLSYGELFFVAGGGYGWLTQSSRPVVDAGVGVRLFQGEWSARLDVRWLSFFNASDTHGELWVALGVSL